MYASDPTTRQMVSKLSSEERLVGSRTVSVLERLVKHVVGIIVHLICDSCLVTNARRLGELLAEVDALLIGDLSRLRCARLR